MNSICFRSCALAAAIMLAFSPSMAQTPVAATAVPAAQPTATKSFSQQDMDQLLAPIALYPDALLAQIFMASTYPLEVIEASRWSKANPKVTGKALEDAMAKMSWDPSVKSLTSVPQVLEQMNDKLEWMQKLGDAFLAQQSDVFDTVQSLRAKAAAAGNLKSTDQQVVKTEVQESKTIYVVESPKTEVVYVPIYNPTVVYGTWWYSYPPYYMYPPAYVYPPYVGFTAGIIVGAAIWGNCNWHSHSVYVNVNHYNSFNRTNININNNSWNHNVDHRRGVAYKDQNVARQYNRGGDMQNARARQDYRGRTDATNMSRPATGDAGGTRLGNGNSNRPSAGTRDTSYGGFSGAGNGASTREASQRGNASRGSSGNRSGGARARH